MLRLWHYPVFLFLFLSSCRSGTRDHRMPATNEVPQTSFPEPATSYLDSSRVQQVLNSGPFNSSQMHNILQFYRDRHYKMAWISPQGLSEYAGNFINLLNSEQPRTISDSTRYRDPLHLAFREAKEKGKNLNPADSSSMVLELLLTVGFFEYAKRNWHGEPEQFSKNLGWFIERKKLDYSTLLTAFLQRKEGLLPFHPPVYQQYDLLKKFLQVYNDLEKDSLWPLHWPLRELFPVQNGDSILFSVKHVLLMTGDLTSADSSLTQDSLFIQGIKNFQQRHGLPVTGILDLETYAQVSTPLNIRIRQLLINMERCRWVPSKIEGDYLAVNIPDFRLLAFRDDSLEWSCKVVVGDLENNTVIFNDELEYIVFSPYWVLPSSIVRKETIPAILKDPHYLKKHQMEVVNSSGEKVSLTVSDWKSMSTNRFPYIIRQKPGENNSLGRVKFLFPNEHHIYLHDTPSRSLFGETRRAFSHGCIRVSEPLKLARHLLRNDTAWTEEKIRKAMYGGKEIWVQLKTKVPVFITYFTAFVSPQGKLNFRNDIYGHDERLKLMMFRE